MIFYDACVFIFLNIFSVCICVCVCRSMAEMCWEGGEFGGLRDDYDQNTLDMYVYNILKE